MAQGNSLQLRVKKVSIKNIKKYSSYLGISDSSTSSEFLTHLLHREGLVVPLEKPVGLHLIESTTLFLSAVQLVKGVLVSPDLIGVVLCEVFPEGVQEPYGLFLVGFA